MRRSLNHSQKIVIVVGLGFMLLVLGSWLSSLDTHPPFGWVAYAPMNGNQNVMTVGGLHPWVRSAIWLMVIAAWIGASLGLLRESRRAGLVDAQSTN